MPDEPRAEAGFGPELLVVIPRSDLLFAQRRAATRNLQLHFEGVALRRHESMAAQLMGAMGVRL